MTLGFSLTVLNRLAACLAVVAMLFALPILDAENDTYPSYDALAVEQDVALAASHTAPCHGAVYCNFAIDHAEAVDAFGIALNSESNLPSEFTLLADRADEFDTPPPRQAFFLL